MALIKKCACGCINDGNEALCRNCGIDILFDTPENIPDEEYEKLMQFQNGASEPANSSQSRVPENSGDAPNSPSGSESAVAREADFGDVFDDKHQSPEQPRAPGTGRPRHERIVVTPIDNSQSRPQLFKFCKCGEVNSPNSQICPRCTSSLEAVAAMTKQQHDKMLEDLQPANVPGKYLQSLDNECVIQPKPMGEKSLIGRSAADKSVSDYLFPRTGVSRKHANFWHDGNNLFIEDIGSTNGTFIDNKKIENNKSYVLKPGNQVSFGNPKGDAAKIAIFKVK